MMKNIIYKSEQDFPRYMESPFPIQPLLSNRPRINK